MIKIRKSAERGVGDHGWLSSQHTFSFASYHDDKYMGYGPLRVINEDHIKAGSGFDTHSHQNMEIISYVVDGALAHKDSTGREKILHPIEVQRMSAGRGIDIALSDGDGAAIENVDLIYLKWNKGAEFIVLDMP